MMNVVIVLDPIEKASLEYVCLVLIVLAKC